MKLLTSELLFEMDKKGEDFRKNFVVLDKHPDFVDQWFVNAFDESFFYEIEDKIGRYRAISVLQIDGFIKLCEEMGKEVIWTEDPSESIKKQVALNDIPEVKIESPFDDTINGFLPFQVQGFNFLKNLKGGVVEWSTGTGKTVIASALLKYHYDQHNFDLALFVVKSHNTINTQRSLQRLVGIDSTVIRGNRAKREKLYSEAVSDRQVLILNYEKFRVDTEELKNIIGGKRVLIIWDEMPTKLKNRSSQMYKSVIQCLYDTHPPRVSKDKQRAELRQYMLSATPIENNPEDFFNCVRVIDPDIYGSIKEFRDEYVKRFDHFDRSKPAEWHNLDKMGLKAAHIVHQVDKNDEDIAGMFPNVISEPYFIDWNDKQRSVYDKIIKKSRESDSDEANTLAVITLLQMLCNLPTMITNSAANYEIFEKAFEEALSGESVPDKKGSELAFKLVNDIGADKITNDGHAKLEVLKSLITEVHPDEKITVFSAFNNGLMPDLRKYFDEWGVSHVYYGGSSKQRQEAEDKFKSDPNVRVFLSSDAGSDSINLEVGSVCIHYDMPWKWSTYTQRENRIHRVTSEFDTVRVYTLLMADSVEDRKLQVVLDKMGFHDAIFKGAIADQAIGQRMTKEDLMYILKG
jgi:SNF2 family DNA or RNA helicase